MDVTVLVVALVRVDGVPRVIVLSAFKAPPPTTPFPASTLREQLVAVAELPFIEPAIVELNVLTPANVWAPVVTMPAAPAAADGIVTFVPAELVITGPAVVPPVTPRSTVMA